MKRISALLLLVAGLVAVATRSLAHGAVSAPVLVSASVQGIPVSLPEYGSEDQYRILIVWKSATPPVTFFWRPKTGGWQTAAAVRVRRTGKSKLTAGGGGYTTEDIRLSDIKKGDTLEITPMSGGRDIMPASLRKSPTGALYFKAAAGPWQNLRVPKITRLRDAQS